MSENFLENGPKNSKTIVILAHGAGAPMDSPFMDAFAEGIGKKARVIRFEFPYMAARRTSGTKGGPGSANKLIDFFKGIVDQFANDKKRIFIGGKSMGGRVASMIADDTNVDGAICLGYPFHPPGRPEKLRTEHLEQMKTPTLIVQGTRDTFGKKDEVKSYKLARSIKVHWLEDGDHSFKPRKSSGRTEQQNWDEGISAAVAFIRK